jgi:glutamate formiminotransferase
MKKKIIECVPNFSEGRDDEKMAKIIAPFAGREDVILLDRQADPDHNRMVVTVVGEPRAVLEAVIEAVGAAVECIDLRLHQGQHPRMGAVDVVPFVPIRNMSMAEVIDLSREAAARIAATFKLPVYLYEKSAQRPERRNLANIRRGQFEGMAKKIKEHEWRPDYGPAEIHPSAGVTAVGVRMPLIAFNVNLKSTDPSIADTIARKVRESSGGLPCCKAIGVELVEQGMVQVSMNLTDYTRTGLGVVFEEIRQEAKKYDIEVAGSEIVGLAPMAALIDTAVSTLGLGGFSLDQVLENRLLEEAS